MQSLADCCKPGVGEGVGDPSKLSWEHGLGIALSAGGLVAASHQNQGGEEGALT